MSTKGKKVKIIYVISMIVSLFVLNLNARESGYSFSAAIVGMSMDYKEYGVKGIYDAPVNLEELLDSEESMLNEIMGVDYEVKYTNVLENKNYMNFGISFTYLIGQTKYTGSYISSTSKYGSVVSRTLNAVADTALEYTYMHNLNDRIVIGGGVGVGYRYWKRALSSTQIEVYKWFSVRPIVLSEYNINGFTLGLKLEYQYGISPEMLIFADTQNPDTTVKLGSANIFVTSLPLRYSINKNLEIFAEYTYEYQTIEKSNLVDYNGIKNNLWEPRSVANNQYIKLGATFKF